MFQISTDAAQTVIADPCGGLIKIPAADRPEVLSRLVSGLPSGERDKLLAHLLIEPVGQDPA